MFLTTCRIFVEKKCKN